MSDSEGNFVVELRGSAGAVGGRDGGIRHRLGVGRLRRAVAVRAVEELHPAAGDEQDLGREAIAVLAGLAPACRVCSLPSTSASRPFVACRSNMSISPSWKVTTRCHSVLSTFSPLWLFYHYQIQAVPPKRVIFRML